jgi:membrane fusion protein (multidrug efflux system)
MRRFSEITYIALTAVVLVISACGSKTTTEDPMAQLASLKEQKSAIDAQIATLEKEMESKGLIEKKLHTVGLTEIKNTTFSHYIDLQGRVDASESVAATSRIPGTLKKVHVDNGDFVKSGQLLAEIDDAVLQKNMAELEGQLVVATDLYERQKALWDQNIGSEVQYIQAKNNKESLERSMATLKENWGMTKIYAPTSGTVDLVMLKQGQAISPGVPLCNILNLNDLKIVGAVTEAYAAKVKRGDAVKVYFPDLEKEITTRISYVSKSINTVNRTFVVECDLGDGDYRANQIAVMRIVDYSNPNAISIPVNFIQTGEEGDFVVVALKSDVDRQATVQKVQVKQGQNYNGYVEILSGLKAGDMMISTGFQDVNIGETVLY